MWVGSPAEVSVNRGRPGKAPAVLAAVLAAVPAAVRNLASHRTPPAGTVNIAAARRTAALKPKTLLQLLRRPAKPDVTVQVLLGVAA